MNEQSNFNAFEHVKQKVGKELKCCLCERIQGFGDAFLGSRIGEEGNYTYVFWCNNCWEEKEKSNE